MFLRAAVYVCATGKALVDQRLCCKDGWVLLVRKGQREIASSGTRHATFVAMSLY